MAKHLFWMDLEMTGLNEKVHHLLEISVVITDVYLNRLDDYHRIIYQPPHILEEMDPWCKENHKLSGLTAAVTNGIPLKQVELELLAFTKKYYKNEDEKIILSGNSINSDKRFIEYHMPLFAKKLHYRVIDVSSFKEIFKERYGIKFVKNNTHRATQDVLESINELNYYLSFIKTQ